MSAINQITKATKAIYYDTPSILRATQATALLAGTLLGVGGQGGAGAPSASRELVACGHGGAGAPSATNACFLTLVWTMVKAARSEQAASTTTDTVRFIGLASLSVDVRGNLGIATPTQRCYKWGCFGMFFFAENTPFHRHAHS
jgi:hypothetical protein